MSALTREKRDMSPLRRSLVVTDPVHLGAMRAVVGVTGPVDRFGGHVRPGEATTWRLACLGWWLAARSPLSVARREVLPSLAFQLSVQWLAAAAEPAGLSGRILEIGAAHRLGRSDAARASRRRAAVNLRGDPAFAGLPPAHPLAAALEMLTRTDRQDVLALVYGHAVARTYRGAANRHPFDTDRRERWARAWSSLAAERGFTWSDRADPADEPVNGPDVNLRLPWERSGSGPYIPGPAEAADGDALVADIAEDDFADAT
ncbi:hypothetical protein [Kitasatospora sp. NPDC059327]|uniref:hypothetical protein n=1 Tax=Kitasatospora sp. NPDC059327 TaxID=3346803 RepID=UPI0036C8DB39